MTSTDKKITRIDARTNIVITLTTEGIYTREKGRRTTYGPYTYGSLHLRCAEVNVAATLRQKAEGKAPRRRRVSRGLLTSGR